MTFPTPPGVTVGAPTSGGSTQIQGNESSAIPFSLQCTAGNILYAIITSADATGEQSTISASKAHPTASDGSTFTAIAADAEFSATCATTGLVTFSVLLSQSTLNVVLQVYQYLP